jgi:hypothetical protein
MKEDSQKRSYQFKLNVISVEVTADKIFFLFFSGFHGRKGEKLLGLLSDNFLSNLFYYQKIPLEQNEFSGL